MNDWNTFEIHALGQNYTVILNEITVIPKFSGTKMIRGHIGIQNHDAESHVLFRNISIKYLSESPFTFKILYLFQLLVDTCNVFIIMRTHSAGKGKMLSVKSKLDEDKNLLINLKIA